MLYGEPNSAVCHGFGHGWFGHRSFHSHGDSPNGWVIMDNLIKMDDFGGTPVSGNLHIATAPRIVLADRCDMSRQYPAQAKNSRFMW